MKKTNLTYFISYLPNDKKLEEGCFYTVTGRLPIKLINGTKLFPALVKKYGPTIQTKIDYLNKLNAKVVEPNLCTLTMSIGDDVKVKNINSPFYGKTGKIRYIINNNVIGLDLSERAFHKYELIRSLGKISSDSWVKEGEIILPNEFTIKDGICKIKCPCCKKFL